MENGRDLFAAGSWDYGIDIITATSRSTDIGDTSRQQNTKRTTMDPEDLQRLVTQKMPYGKYKDRLIADLPGHYLAWFAREGFPAGQLGRLLALMHEIDHNNLRELLAPLRDKRG
jgi:uncharacterized protein